MITAQDAKNMVYEYMLYVPVVKSFLQEVNPLIEKEAKKGNSVLYIPIPIEREGCISSKEEIFFIKQILESYGFDVSIAHHNIKISWEGK